MSVSRQQEVLVVLPEGSLPAKQVVLIDAACDGSSLSNTRTVTYKIGCSVSIREERLVLLCRCWRETILETNEPISPST